jgi:hypothetical protein
MRSALAVAEKNLRYRKLRKPAVTAAALNTTSLSAGIESFCKNLDEMFLEYP